jgi:hypothetical protein
MTDIVERLNEIQPHWCVASLETKTVYEVGQICAYAKTEIERLREALLEIAEGDRPDNDEQFCVGYWGATARAALKRESNG